MVSKHKLVPIIVGSGLIISGLAIDSAEQQVIPGDQAITALPLPWGQNKFVSYGGAILIVAGIIVIIWGLAS